MTRCRYTSGDPLPNGATVLASESSPIGEIVLCQWDERFVTWLVSRSGETVSGHYHADRADAYGDFRLRVAGRAA